MHKALIESLPCLVSKACQCIHKSLFRGVTMWARIGLGFPIYLENVYFCFCSEDKRLLYQIFLRINNPCVFFSVKFYLRVECTIGVRRILTSLVFLVNKCFIITTPRGSQCLENIMHPLATGSVGSLHCFIMGLKWFCKLYRNCTFCFHSRAEEKAWR